MSMILPIIGAFGHTAAGGGDGTRRKLVSTSASAATGIHVSIPSSTFSSDHITVAFWWKQPSATGSNANNTVFASHTGKYQLYAGASGSENKLIGRYDGTNATAATGIAATTGDWVFVRFQAGLNYSATEDCLVQITDGTLSDTRFSTAATGASSDDITAAHTQYVMCDDNSGAASDIGFIGETFDFCVFDGLIGTADLQHDGSGSWEDLSATGLAALVYRFDGQVTGDAAYDSSGNGLHGTVENSGVTLSASDLPPGANP